MTPAEYDAINSEYAPYTKSLTGNRIGVNMYTWLTLASNWMRGTVPKYGTSPETALLHAVWSGRYYLDVRMAMTSHNTVHSVSFRL